MLFSKTLKLLICLVMILPYLIYGSTGQASAASNYNHAELMEYDGYGKAMYEGLVDQTTFITGQYTDNKEYVSKSIDQIRDYAKFWWEENKIQGEGVGEKLKDLVSKGGGYALTVADFMKKFFSDTDGKVNPPPVSYEDFYSPYFEVHSWGGQLVARTGYKIEARINGYSVGPTSSIQYNLPASLNTDEGTAYGGLCLSGSCSNYKTISIEEYRSEESALKSLNLGPVMGVLTKYGVTVVVHKNDKPLDLGSPIRPTDNSYKTINNYVQNGMDDKPMVIPQPKPSLTCPGGEKINLTVDGSTFLGSDGKVMVVNKDGTAIVNGTSCSLNWEKPVVDYVDGQTAITDPQGNWLDVLTGDILKCMVTGDCKPSVPGDKEEVEDLDTGLIAYVKNAYEYATGVLKTATDGLKSLAAGAKDLTALFGVFFSWLPKEMVVLMSSGLALAIGLRLFRK